MGKPLSRKRLPGCRRETAAGSLLHVFRRMRKRTAGMDHERIMAGLVQIIVRYSKLRKNYKNDSKVKIDGKGIMPYDGDIKQTGR